MNTRKKFTTTLTEEHKRRLQTLASMEGLKANDLIEKLVDIEWGKFINEMGNESNRREQINRNDK